jgi:hypothetical protein
VGLGLKPMRYLASLAAALLAAACYAEPPPPTKAPAEPSAATAPPPADTNAITSEGWGPLRIGMTRDQVTAAVGATATPNAVGGADPESCDLFHPARAPEGMLVMIQRDALTSITLRNNTTLKTDRGFGVGDSASAIKAAYGASARVEPHHYIGLPAEYITVWTAHGPTSAETFVQNPAARGIRYETDAEGVVTAVHAGGISIQNVEGCS